MARRRQLSIRQRSIRLRERFEDFQIDRQVCRCGLKMLVMPKTHHEG